MTNVVPDSRSYVHSKCGQSTEVGGGDFGNMAAPVPGMNRTMCVACGGAFPIEEFRWEDTNEEILAYYERHRQRIPALTQILCSRPVGLAVIFGGFLLGIMIGIFAGSLLGVTWGVVVGAVAAIIGALATLIIWDAIEQRLLCSALQVPNVRYLK